MVNKNRMENYRKILDFLKTIDKQTIHQICLGAKVNWETARNAVRDLEMLGVIYSEPHSRANIRLYSTEEPITLWKKRCEIMTTTIHILENKIETLKEIIKDNEIRKYKGITEIRGEER